MSDIRSRRCRDDHGLSRGEGEFRVDQAFSVIRAMPSLTPIGCWLQAEHLKTVVEKKVFFPKTKARREFLPDFLSFVVYAFTVLEYVAAKRPDAERVDFIVEKNTRVTGYLQEFSDEIKDSSTALGKNHLVPLQGKEISISTMSSVMLR